MARTLPSRSALIAFEAAARHESFTSAAAELALSESAVSRQVSTLEDLLQIKLFNRVKKRVKLTRAGTLYSKQVRKTLSQLEQDMTNIMAYAGGREILELALLPTFGSQWLIPRLPRFYKHHPEITINTAARSVMFLIKETTFDAAIHYGQPNWPGTVADLLFREEVVTVCSPQLLKEKKLEKVEDIARCPLLHLTSRPEAWNEWMKPIGLLGINTIFGSRHEHFSTLISATCAGLGMALIPRFLITEELKRQQLVIAFDHQLQNDDAYYLVYPEENLSSNVLKQFRNWLLDEVKIFEGS